MSAIVYRPGATFCDVCSVRDTWAMVRVAGTQWICEVNGLEVWRVDVGVNALYLRIAADPDGGVLALAQGDYPNGDLIAVYNGSPPLIVTPTYGQSVVVVEFIAGSFLAFVQVGPTTARRMRFRGATWNDTNLFTIPATSQGFLDIKAGEPLLTDSNRLKSLRGQRVALPNQEAGMLVGQWVDKPGMAAMLIEEPVQFTAIDGLCYEPHLAALADGRFIVCARTERDGAAYRVLSPPWPVDAAEPVPDVPVEPPSSPPPSTSPPITPPVRPPKEPVVPQPYEEPWVLDRAKEARDLYREAGREPDDLYPIWTARTAYDIGAGLTKEASWKKHRAELRAALGLPAENPQ